MGKADPRPNTRNAHPQRGQPSDGTGQHADGIVDPEPGKRAGRMNDSPSKSSGLSKSETDHDGRSKTAQSQTTALSQRTTSAPEPDRPAGFKMVRDSGAKTAREREFNAKIGTPGGPQWQTVYEKNDATLDFQHIQGTKTGYRAKKAQ